MTIFRLFSPKLIFKCVSHNVYLKKQPDEAKSLLKSPLDPIPFPSSHSHHFDACLLKYFSLCLHTQLYPWKKHGIILSAFGGGGSF